MAQAQRMMAPSPDAWIQMCEACLRAGDFAGLAHLLEQPAGLDVAPDVLFYRARLAISVVNFEEAVRLFWQAGRDAHMQGRVAFQQRCLIWAAFAESQMGNYGRARELADRMERVVSSDEPVYADICFVRGLIASEQGTLPEAQTWMERAKNSAITIQDQWMEARCCANLAVIYNAQGFLDRCSSMIRRVERLNATPQHIPNRQQLIQVRNTQIHNLRFRGEHERALRLAEPLPEPQDDGSTLFAGYLALSAAMVAADLGRFAQAEQLWERAYAWLHAVIDDHRTMAELLWERAWIRLRQGALDAANQAVREALELIDDKMETECYHAYVVDAIISIRRNDLGRIGFILRRAADRFREVGHRLGLASVLLRIAAYHIQRGQLGPGRDTLAEALTLMWKHHLYSSYYWEPEVIAALCREAMQEDIWGEQAPALAARLLGISEAQVEAMFAIEGGPAGMWGEFAASLATCRLADDYWSEFMPLLNDTRPQVRRRAAQVLSASRHPQAQAAIATLRADPDPEVQRYFATTSATPPPVQVYTFGRFAVLLHGKPLQLSRASTRKALLIFGALLLLGEQGMERDDLALLVWPEKKPADRVGVLQTTVSALRAELRNALGKSNAADAIQWASGRYYLNLQTPDLWWDWRFLQQLLSQRAPIAERLDVAAGLYQQHFMPNLSELVPPSQIDQMTERMWDRVASSLRDLATDFELQAAEWMEELRAEVPND